MIPFENKREFLKKYRSSYWAQYGVVFEINIYNFKNHFEANPSVTILEHAQNHISLIGGQSNIKTKILHKTVMLKKRRQIVDRRFSIY